MIFLRMVAHTSDPLFFFSFLVLGLVCNSNTQRRAKKFSTLEISKHFIAILTFTETFKE